MEILSSFYNLGTMGRRYVQDEEDEDGAEALTEVVRAASLGLRTRAPPRDRQPPVVEVPVSKRSRPSRSKAAAARSRWQTTGHSDSEEDSSSESVVPTRSAPSYLRRSASMKAEARIRQEVRGKPASRGPSRRRNASPSWESSSSLASSSMDEEEEEEEEEEDESSEEENNEEDSSSEVEISLVASSSSRTASKKRRLAGAGRAKPPPRKATRRRDDVRGDSEPSYDEDDVIEWAGESGSDAEAVDPAEERAKAIEKILDHRAIESAVQDGESKPDEDDADERNLEFLIKWKHRSYRNVSWESYTALMEHRLSRGKVQRYLANPPLNEDGEPFPSEYCEVDRVIAEDETEDSDSSDEGSDDQDRKQEDSHEGDHDVDIQMGESEGLVGQRKAKKHGKKKQYLVKWSGLTYEESTWESATEVRDDEAVELFHRRNRPPTREWLNGGTGRFTPYKETPEFKNGNTLRSYQLEGLNWLVFNWYQKRNSILADEMGLGKTVQSLLVLWHLWSVERRWGPFLIIAPLSTIHHWKRECEAWTDMNLVVYHGGAESREVIHQHELAYPGRKVGAPYRFHILVTTFEMILACGHEFLQGVHWEYLIVDEAHRLKNRRSKILEVLQQYRFRHMHLLTGTPIQNNTDELWTILSFLEPDKFQDREWFMQQFGELKSAEQVELLHRLIRPHLLRRMKGDVDKSIAPKEETIVTVELTTVQKQWYRAIYDRNYEFLRKGSGSAANFPNMVNIMMQLRNCCNHPFLLRGVEERVTEGADSNDELFRRMLSSSAKLVLIDKLLPKLRAGGHKVLIFSQMVRMLDILEDYLRHRGYLFERIDGTVRGNDRQAAIDRFSREGSDRFVFLLCTRAGGVGINLTAADTVIIYDSDWNPQNDLQAQARAHRIGQKQMVKVYRLLTNNPCEKFIFESASKKLGLDKAVFGKLLQQSSGAGEAGSSSSTSSTHKQATSTEDVRKNRKALDTLLRLGAYDLFSGDKQDTRYDEEDIDQILERSSQVVMHKEEEASSGEVDGLQSFSKASFVASGASADVNLDDPDFWAKVMPDAAAAVVDPHIAIGPRIRRQVDRLSERDLLDPPSSAASGSSHAHHRSNTAAAASHEDSSDPKVWSASDRDRVRCNLVRFGVGRWELVKQRVSTAHSRAEVARFSRAMLELFVEKSLGDHATPEEVRAQLRPLWNASSLEVDMDPVDDPSKECEAWEADHSEWKALLNEPSLQKADFVGLLQSSSKSYVKQLHRAAIVGAFVRSCHERRDELETRLVALVAHQTLGHPPSVQADWWTLADDAALILGCYHCGIPIKNAFDAVVNHPDYGFLGRVQISKKDAGAKDASSSAKKEDDMMEEEDPQPTPAEEIGDGGSIPGGPGTSATASSASTSSLLEFPDGTRLKKRLQWFVRYMPKFLTAEPAPTKESGGGDRRRTAPKSTSSSALAPSLHVSKKKKGGSGSSAQLGGGEGGGSPSNASTAPLPTSHPNGRMSTESGVTSPKWSKDEKRALFNLLTSNFQLSYENYPDRWLAIQREAGLVRKEIPAVQEFCERLMAMCGDAERSLRHSRQSTATSTRQGEIADEVGISISRARFFTRRLNLFTLLRKHLIALDGSLKDRFLAVLPSIPREKNPSKDHPTGSLASNSKANNKKEDGSMESEELLRSTGLDGEILSPKEEVASATPLDARKTLEIKPSSSVGRQHKLKGVQKDDTEEVAEAAPSNPSKKLDSAAEPESGSAMIPSTRFFPVWWRSGRHDMDVVRGIWKHGFGAWKSICEDPELSSFQAEGVAPATEWRDDDVASMLLVMVRAVAASPSVDMRAFARGELASKKISSTSGKQGKLDAFFNLKPKDPASPVDATADTMIVEDSPVLTASSASSSALPARKGRPRNAPAGGSKATAAAAAAAAAVQPIVYPLKVASNLILINIGEVEASAGYHTNGYIYPVGYHVRIVYNDERFDCKILRGDQGPLFSVQSLDDPSKHQEGPSPTAPWRAITNGKVGGPGLFKMRIPRIRALIESLPGAADLPLYEWGAEADSTRSASDLPDSATGVMVDVDSDELDVINPSSHPSQNGRGEDLESVQDES